jgi:electron transfer flavoprotein alpha/beta subunit
VSPAQGLRILVPVAGAFHGKVRVRRQQGTLDTEGLERVLSPQSLEAIALARQLQAHGASLVAVHPDLGGGEAVLREALAHGADQGILIGGLAEHAPDATARAAAIAEVYRQNGPFDAVVGPGRSEFAGFSGAMAALAGALELPCVVGVSRIAPEDDSFRIQYQSLFGDYDLRIPRPCVVVAGGVAPSHPTAWGIHDAYRVRGVLRVTADPGVAAHSASRRLRIEAVQPEARAAEPVDGETLVRRMRSRGLVPERRQA